MSNIQERDACRLVQTRCDHGPNTMEAWKHQENTEKIAKHIRKFLSWNSDYSGNIEPTCPRWRALYQKKARCCLKTGLLEATLLIFLKSKFLWFFPGTVSAILKHRTKTNSHDRKNQGESGKNCFILYPFYHPDFAVCNRASLEFPS